MPRISRGVLYGSLLVTSGTLGVFLLAPACQTDSTTAPSAATVPCSVTDAYDLLNILDFEGDKSGWFQFTDHTPGGLPDLDAGSDTPTVELDPPHCGSAHAMRMQSQGNNFWGAGFGDWQNNQKASAAQGPGYDGIAFWAKAQGNSNKTFGLKVDDGQTFAMAPAVTVLPDGGVELPKPGSCDQDLDGDGYIGPGDIVCGSRCRLPPPAALGSPTCYYGGTQAPSVVSRVPAPDECGNSFHTFVTVTSDWQFYVLPWSKLVQSPCPNRLAGGIDPSDIRSLAVSFMQGQNYDILLDDISFYRRR